MASSPALPAAPRMDCDEIVKRLRANEARLREKGVLHLALFGSRARGTPRDDSDLDVLVDIDPALPRFSLLDLAGVALMLEDLLGLEANVVERSGLTPRLKARIADDVREVF